MMMAQEGQAVTASPLLADVLALSAAALPEVAAQLAAARALVGPKAAALDEHQYAAHALAWLASYAEALRQLYLWAARLAAAGCFGEIEALILQIGFGEYLAQIHGGIAMSQGEVARLQDAGLAAVVWGAAASWLMAMGNTAAARARLVVLMQDNAGRATFGATGLDAELEMIRDQFRRFADEKVVPFAHGWHLRDELIPMEVITALAAMGVFGLTIPEEFGGVGLSKTAMVVVSEELSHGYLGVGSLGTRSEIAAELILCGGTPAQKAAWLPKLASGEILPTAVFTEPDTGSDLGALRTWALRVGDDWQVTGNKTWITHAARAHLMILLARTNKDSSDYNGLSMFLAEKLPGTEAEPFPTPGMTGGETGHDRGRDRGSGLSRHEGIRAGVRRLSRGGGQPARRGAGAGFQAVDADVRVRAHPDGGAGGGGGAIGAGGGDALCAGPQAVRPGADRNFRGWAASWR